MKINDIRKKMLYVCGHWTRRQKTNTLRLACFECELTQSLFIGGTFLELYNLSNIYWVFFEYLSISFGYLHLTAASEPSLYLRTEWIIYPQLVNMAHVSVSGTTRQLSMLICLPFVLVSLLLTMSMSSSKFYSRWGTADILIVRTIILTTARPTGLAIFGLHTMKPR